MPIELYTGKPGNFKTAFLVARMIAESKKDSPRPLIAYGINELEPGIATIMTNPEKWNDIDPEGEPVCDCPAPGDKELVKRPLHAHVVPNGSLVFVDEAWKWFGHLQDASRQPTPPHAIALAEHRHRGIDFVWTAQGPNQIYPFVRPLIDEHTHFVRKFKSLIVDRYVWGEMQDSVKSNSTRDAATKTTVTAPKHVFGKYKSASEHTIKTKIPAKVFALPAVLLAAGALLYFGIQAARPSKMAESYRAKEGASGLPDARPSIYASSSDRPGTTEPESAADYAKRHLPRFPTMPHTAPIYDDRTVTADPVIYCMASASGRDAQGVHHGSSVSCLTEQGTRYDLPEEQALYVARWGQPYNAYRQNNRGYREAGEYANPHGSQQPAGQPTIAALSAPQQSTYGDLGITNNPGG